MSKEIFEEVSYNRYLIDQNWDKLEGNTSELTESFTGETLDSYPKLSPKEALDILNNIYTQNSYLLYKEPWYNLLFKRLQKDIKRGFVNMIVIKPSAFQKAIRFITPVLKLFSKANFFTKLLNDTNMFYETSLGGCYMSKANKLLIVTEYIDKSNINLDMLKTILHEYCHFYARKKHDLYVKFFEEMVGKFYKALIEAICEAFKLDIDRNTKKRLYDTIMKWNFYKLDNFKAKRFNFDKCVDELDLIHEEFTKLYVNMLLSKIQFKKNDDLFINSTEIIRRAYLAISDEVTSAHIAKYDYSYQEFYCADEIIAIMSFYKPNYKPYLQMLESLV